MPDLRGDPAPHVLGRGVLGQTVAPVRYHVLLEQLPLLARFVPLAQCLAMLEVGVSELRDVQLGSGDSARRPRRSVLPRHPDAALDLEDDVIEFLPRASLRP